MRLAAWAIALFAAACAGSAAAPVHDVCVVRAGDGTSLSQTGCARPGEECFTDAVCNERCADGGSGCCYHDVSRHAGDDRCHRRAPVKKSALRVNRVARSRSRGATRSSPACCACPDA